MVEATIQGLIDRLEKATRGDRKIDHDLYAVLICTTPELQAHLRGMDASNGHGHPAYTHSVDAALALVERKLTDEQNMLYNYDLGWHASSWANMAFTADLHVAVGNPPDMRQYHGQSYTLPLAICLALLRALNGEER